MRLRRVWWICDGCGRETHSIVRPHRCERDRLGKHPVMRPMGPRFFSLACTPGDAARLAELLEQIGMSLQSLGPMFLSRRCAEEDARQVGPPIPDPAQGGKT